MMFYYDAQKVDMDLQQLIIPKKKKSDDVNPIKYKEKIRYKKYLLVFVHSA